MSGSPRVIATFWMKSQTLLYSLVGSQSSAPTWLYRPRLICGRSAVQASGRIVAADPDRLEFIRVSVRLGTRSHQTAECRGGFPK